MHLGRSVTNEIWVALFADDLVTFPWRPRPKDRGPITIERKGKDKLVVFANRTDLNAPVVRLLDQDLVETLVAALWVPLQVTTALNRAYDAEDNFR